MNFAEIERDYIRKHLLPDFEWTRFKVPSRHNPLKRPLSQCRVAIVSTSGAYIKGKDKPFDTKNKYGDDSFRIIPADADAEEIGLSHPGYNTRRSLKDIDTVFPITTLRAFYLEGFIGSISPRHISFMGYVPDPERLIWQRAPEAGRILIEDAVDLVVLVPA